MKNYRYEIPSDTGFRNYTVNEDVDNLNPDGFESDASTGDHIIETVCKRNGLVLCDSWDIIGAEGAERRLYWGSEEDAVNDAGANAAGQIIRYPLSEG